jgi:hypothetical protein
MVWTYSASKISYAGKKAQGQQKWQWSKTYPCTSNNRIKVNFLHHIKCVSSQSLQIVRGHSFLTWAPATNVSDKKNHGQTRISPYIGKPFILLLRFWSRASLTWIPEILHLKSSLSPWNILTCLRQRYHRKFYATIGFKVTDSLQ